MDDRAGVHQRRGEGVFNGLDGVGEGAADEAKRVLAVARGKDTRRQARGARGDGNLGGPVLARQPGQRAGFSGGDVGGDAEVAQAARYEIGAESAGRQEDHLAI